MSAFNSLAFYITGTPGEIAPGHPLWDHPLAGRSQEFSSRSRTNDAGWTIGEYFTAAAAFVSTSSVLESLTDAVCAGLGEPGGWQVLFDLQKHGAFYHPIKMTVSAQGGRSPQVFVLNGAVTDHGCELARGEAALFARLSVQIPFRVTPEVYAAGEVRHPPGRAGFLMARWLEGYYEFHSTGDSGNRKIVVWCPEDEDLYLSMDQALPVYENIARILTLAYDLESGDQVLLWHHAAGDFILAPDQAGLPVKLITVRGYGPLVDDAIPASGPLPGLLFFFVNLCLRMQLDRLDGVGEPVFLGRPVLEATMRGFLKGIAEITGEKGEAAAKNVWDFFISFSQDQFLAVLEQVIEAWPPGSSEMGLIAAQMPSFAGQIQDLFKSGHVSDFY